MSLSADTLFSSFSGLPKFNRLLVGYSGGLDSHVLLHLCANMAQFHDIDLLAIHVNHGLQQKAVEWGLHCREVCGSLGVAYHQIDLDLKPSKGASLEAEAREARYAAIQSEMQPGDILLTAHHQEDQAETLLLQLLRGSGVHGLAAMPALMVFGKGYLFRPLLNHSKRDLQAYADQHQLAWVDDPSNFDTDFDRNFLRQRVFPVMRERWPSLAGTISRSAGYCAEARDLIDEIAGQDLSGLLDAETNTLQLSELRMLSEMRIRSVLRHWIQLSGYRTPSSKRLQEIISQVFGAAEDRSPVIAWDHLEVRRYRDRLYMMKQSDPVPENLKLEWNGDEKLELPGQLGCLVFERDFGGISEQKLANRHLTVRFNVSGMSYYPSGQSHHQSLKNFFQQQGIPPWERKKIPCLFADDELVAVGELLINAPFAAGANEKGLSLRWYRST